MTAALQSLLVAAAAHHRANRFAEASDLYRRILAARPDHAGVLHVAGICAGQSGDPEGAVRLIERALLFGARPELRATLADACHALGARRLAQRDPTAVEALSRAIRLAPDAAGLHEDLAWACELTGDTVRTMAAWRRAVTLRPSAPAYGNLGRLLNLTGDPDGAIQAARRAIRLVPELAEAFANLGQSELAVGHHAAAELSLRRAVVLKPELTEAYIGLGRALHERAAYGMALAAYGRASVIAPEAPGAHWNRAFALLLLGDYRRGWEAYEWRWKFHAPRLHAAPLWAGDDLTGRTILLWHEQGYGDLIQSIRFAGRLRTRGARIVLECPRPIMALMRRARGVDEVVADGDPLPPFDTHLPVMSLPGRLGLDTEGVRETVPYFDLDPAVVSRWRARLAGPSGLRVGLVWAGSPAYGRDSSRSIPLRELAPLLAAPGVRWFGLQFGRGREEVPADGVPGLTDLAPEVEAFEEMAAAIAALDLVVTVDTAVGHLAGALGVPVWLMLPFVPHWPWMLDRADTPWYPGTRLFRQPSPGDWGVVTGCILQELGAFRALADGDRSHFPFPHLLSTRRTRSMDPLADLISLFNGMEGWSGTAPQNFMVNFLGVKTNVDFYRDESGRFAKNSHNETMRPIMAGPRDETVPRPPISSGEAFFEAAAVVRSVRQAKDRYVMVELGGGYGARAVDAVTALHRLNPLPNTTVVVEPVPGHVTMAKQHFINNDIPTDGHWFLTAAVSFDNVPQLIPLGTGRFGNTVAATPMLETIQRLVQDHDRAKAVALSLAHQKKVILVGANNVVDSVFGFVSCMTLADILFPFEVVDLIDMDIQTFEAVVVPRNMELLARKVKMLNIGTHSPDIHQTLLDLFRREGWTILAEYGPYESFETPHGSFRTGDGVLMVENPRAAEMRHRG